MIGSVFFRRLTHALLNKIRRKIIPFEPYDKKDRIQQVVSELSKLSLNFEDGDKKLWTLRTVIC